jgi:hypothetical protein
VRGAARVRLQSTATAAATTAATTAATAAATATATAADRHRHRRRKDSNHELRIKNHELRIKDRLRIYSSTLNPTQKRACPSGGEGEKRRTSGSQHHLCNNTRQ